MIHKPLVVITHRFDHQVLLQSKYHPTLNFQYCKNVFDSQMDFSEARGLILRSGLTVEAELLEIFPKLEIVVTATSGFDHLNLKLLQQRSIRAYHLPQPQVQAAAELTLLHLLNSHRLAPKAWQQVQSGQWQREQLMGKELFSRQLGIIGLGRVGLRVAEMALGLGMKVCAHDPYRIDHDPRVQMMGFEELMRTSDIISLHVPLSGLTRQMINGRTLAWMAPDATLINMSRGEVINEDDLIQHLGDYRSFSAALDVFQHEPLSADSKLLSLPNVTLTPHIGASTIEALRKSSEGAIEKMEAYFSGLDPQEDLLPPQATWFYNDSKRR